MNSLVSIVIPTCNNARYINAAVDSGLAQTYPHCEIVVVDDGSTDGTSNLLHECYGDQIQCIRQDNMGPAGARNRGIREARGEFIQFCDADDQLLPEKIARCMAVFEQTPDLGVVYTRYQHVEANGVTLVQRETPRLYSGDVFCDLLLSNGLAVQPSTALVRRDALLEIGLFDDQPDLRCGEDWDVFLRLASRYRFASLDEILVHYRNHPTSVSTNKLCIARGRLMVIQKARHYGRRTSCLDDAAYDRLEAGRQHVLAMVLWEMGQRTSARQHLSAAIRLDPQNSRARRLTLLLTYVAPARSTALIDRAGRWLKRLT